MDDSTASSTTETISSTTTPSVPTPPFTIAKPSRPTPGVTGGSLCRMKSGSSVVLDTIDGIEAESRKLPSSKYKGVVPQPNGRWGAQIYEKHQRVWLGTFNEENDAARAYDIAAQRFRSRDAVTNFKPLSAAGSVDGDDRIEINFLISHSKAEIVDMLRKHTYHDELEQSKKSFKLNCGFGNIHGRPNGKADGLHVRADKAPHEQLFEKVVTPSDVGKLNRLVIPKQHAEKHFPLQAGGDTLKGVLLNFADAHEKVWRFRYSYWNSSQSYVFTKGWSRFVKEKDLKAGDIVSFHKSIGPDENQLYIDWRAKPENGVKGSSSVVVDCNGFISPVVNSVCSPPPPPTTTTTVAPPMFRLFGVNISSSGGGGGGGGGGDVVVESGISNGCSGVKRMREVKLFSLLESASCKKHTVVGGSI